MTGTTKPPSQAQLVANRRNAVRSTGPRTIEGKSRSSRNALKHGLCASKAIVPGESEEEFAAFRNQLWASLAPTNPLEDVLVERVILSFWGLRRAGQIFNDLLDRVAQSRRTQQFTKTGGRYLRVESEIGWAFEATDGDTLDRLARHETRLERSAMRALQALEQLRCSEVPLAVDVSGQQLDLFDDADTQSVVANEELADRSILSFSDLAKLPRVSE